MRPVKRAALTAVVSYSACFAGVQRAIGNGAVDAEAAAVARRDQLQSAQDEIRGWWKLKKSLTDEMAAGRLSFRAAVEGLAASEYAQSDAVIGRLRDVYRLDSARDCCATNLLLYALDSLRHDPAKSRRWMPAWVIAT